MGRCAIRSVAVAVIVAAISVPGDAATAPQALQASPVPPVSLFRPVPGALLRGFDPPGHLGLDLRAWRGEAVAAPIRGTVLFAGQVASVLWVTVSPSPGVLVTVGHLDAISVMAGQPVSAGTPLGTSSGNAHALQQGLHISVRVEGQYVDPGPMLGETAAVSLSVRARLIPESVDHADEASADAVIDLVLSLAGQVGGDAARAALFRGEPEIELAPAIHLERGKPEIELGPATYIEREGHEGRAYVAFGDSLTTGFSVATCREDRTASPYGCVGEPPATPYPELVARVAGPPYDDLLRVGIWGDRVEAAARAYGDGHNDVGDWQPQLSAVARARDLVTGALGINDMEFANVVLWIGAALRLNLGEKARSRVEGLDGPLDVAFGAMREASERGARVVVALYYNPYGSCVTLSWIADAIVSPLNAELRERAVASGFEVADFHQAFRGHGAGSSDPWVFATTCNPTDALSAFARAVNLWCLPCNTLHGVWDGFKRQLAVRFDPHPNEKGTNAMAETILEVIGE